MSEASLSFFDPAPSDASLPLRLPDPFADRPPHPLARLAADTLMEDLAEGRALDPSGLFAPEGGKMFGVLVVRDVEGRVGFLRAFSGALDGRFHVPGFSPPVFDERSREAIEQPGQGCVARLSARVEAERDEASLGEKECSLRTLVEAHRAERDGLAQRHDANKRSRDERRPHAANDAQRFGLDQESRRDKAEKRALIEAHREQVASSERALARARRRVAAAERLRAAVSRALMRQIHDTYRIRSFDGEERSLRALFDGAPPSGAGDCAAPKLFADAQRRGLKPLALAEFFFGAPSATSGRKHGAYYPSCRGKCGPLLPFLLRGLEVERVPPPGAAPRHVDLNVLFEDEALLVIDKPEGLLSVPGRGASLADSVQTRVRARFPHARGPLVVHRLDLDTSGLLVLALTEDAYRALQRQFAARTVEKRYVALIEGLLDRDEGEISLPLRVDLHDRPRQLHDPVHGRPAFTRFEVRSRERDATRLHLFPKTGRTHQLRVHAAHPLGLGRPIVGDRLYGGRVATRLMLHAERLSFIHPVTGKVCTFDSPAPF